jgi:putative isomerase
MNEAKNLSTAMKRGFNTYYNNSVLTHVLMPEGIAIGLAFKFYNTAKVLRESLIGRQGEDDETIHPGPRSYDGRYTELRLSSSGQEFLIQSCTHEGDQCILVTPTKILRRPPTLLVSIAILWNGEGQVWRETDRLAARTPGKDLAVFTDGEAVRQLNTGLTNPYLAVELSRPVAISTGRRIGAAELSGMMEKAKRLVIGENRKYGELAECYNAMRTCLAWDTIYEPETDRICSTVSRIWNVNWGGYVLFDWDTYFASLMAMVENRDLAYANAIAITHQKTEAGFVPNFGSADGFKSRDRSQPPVGSMVVRELYRAYREKWLVEYLFDDLLGWNRWFAGHRMLGNGQICLGSDPYDDGMDRHWGSMGVNEVLGAVLESGQDNSPLYDGMPFDPGTHLMSLADVGFTGLYIHDCECLADLAGVLARPEAGELRARAELCKRGLEGLWNEELGIYCNRRTDTGEFSTRIGPTNFYALYSDKVTSERAQRMMREHFFNGEEFYGEYMIPSIARNDPAYRDQNYWRGRIWAPLNLLVYIALRKQGLTDAGRVLADKGRKVLMKEWTSNGHVHENFNGDTGEGCDVSSSDRFYHWGALLSLVSLIEAGFVPGLERPL